MRTMPSRTLALAFHKWGYIDKTRTIVIAPRTLIIAKDFHNGLAYVSTKGGECGYIDKSGSYVWKGVRPSRY
jgi:hypothetical protein